jgi:hypothetical protein
MRMVRRPASDHVQNGVDRHPPTSSVMNVGVAQCARMLGNRFAHVPPDLRDLPTRGAYSVSVVIRYDIVVLMRLNRP